MAKLPLHVAIIFLMITGCIGPRIPNIPWNDAINQPLLDIYYGTYPPDEHHLDRMKAEWARQLPGYNEDQAEKLNKRIGVLLQTYWRQWMNHSPSEREELEETLANIYEETNNGQPHHEMRMLTELFRIHPQYFVEYEMMRSIVYRWYGLYTPFGKQINAKDVDWTPQRKADLLYITEQAKAGFGNQRDKIKSRWLQMHRHLNVSAESLSKYANKLRTKYKYEPKLEEKLEAEQKYRVLSALESDATGDEGFSQKVKKINWSHQMNADVMYIDSMVRRLNENLAGNMETRWRQMNKNLPPMRGSVLLARVHHLYSRKYQPRPGDIKDAMERYEALPPLPQGIPPKRAGKRKTEEPRNRKGKETLRTYQDKSTFPSFRITSEQISWFRRKTGENGTSHEEHAHHPHQTHYYGGSSHTPSDQGSFGSPTDTPRPLHQWHPGGSSRYTPIDQSLFDSLLDVPHPYHQWYPGESSSSHIPTDQAPPSTQSHFSNPYDQQWYPGSSSNHSQHPPQQ